MAGITQGRPEVAVGEPIRFGDIDGFELEQHPVSDRLIIRDTENGTVAYVRAERGGSIGGDGVLIKALKESKPMADTGRTYDTIQEAERAASAWVFVPPGTYNESININTQGLTLTGSGYNTHIDGGAAIPIEIHEDNVTVENISVETAGGDNVPAIETDGNLYNLLFQNITIRFTNHYAINANSAFDSVVTNCIVKDAGVDNTEFTRGISIGQNGIISNCIFDATIGNTVQESLRVGTNGIISNNIVIAAEKSGIQVNAENTIATGNRVISSSGNGINVTSDNNIIANNRVSDSTNADIQDAGTGNLLDGNLTGASN